jgi:hypothetical protein
VAAQPARQIVSSKVIIAGFIAFPFFQYPADASAGGMNASIEDARQTAMLKKKKSLFVG